MIMNLYCKPNFSDSAKDLTSKGYHWVAMVAETYIFVYLGDDPGGSHARTQCQQRALTLHPRALCSPRVRRAARKLCARVLLQAWPSSPSPSSTTPRSR